ncbi:hemagglutinin/amebocyte aggregation factor [Elysia marginata]|uniref:Hemagglutinin/amebocyte aggregation factor n=1 Tax=Elysia marginata TaxID=1093978 RepID=A0AAV4F8J4_9GAST|nr:hemagglutinin/amebocyte aggregation factor [Elysia marginata]
MIAVTLVAVTLLSMVSATALNKANDHKGHLYFTCPGDNEIITRVRSEHDDGPEDRKWEFGCGNAPSGANLSDCAWSRFTGYFEGPSLYQCHNGGVITGWRAFFKDTDRQNRYRCCKPSKGYLTHSCFYTGYVNDFNEMINYRVPDGHVISGVFSEYSSKDKDRRYVFNVCSLDLSAKTSN